MGTERLFPSFCARYGSCVGKWATDANSGFSPQEKQAIGATRESFLRYIHPLDESFFPGKVGLDAGCGSSACRPL